LANAALQLANSDKVVVGSLLALEALPDAKSVDGGRARRPYWPQAEFALDTMRRTLRELAQLRGHESYVWSVAVMPDGSRIVTGSDDKTARIWDAATGRELAQLKGHVGPVSSVAVTPNGSRIVTGSDDKTARVWDMVSNHELARLEGHGGPVRSVAVTPDGSRIVTGSPDNTARIWEIFASTQALVEHARRLVPRCLTPNERERYYLSPAPPQWRYHLQKWPYIPAARRVGAPTPR
jgi:WD40 repeat protein